MVGRASARVSSILVLVALFAGCNEKAIPPAGDDGGHHASDTLTAEQASKVLAKVGDRTITLGDYVAALEHMDQFDRLRYQSPERRKELLGEMINVELLAQEARAKGYDKDPQTQEEVRAVLRDAMLKQARVGAPQPADIPQAEVQAYYDAHHADYRDPERRRVSAIVLGTPAAADAALEQAKKATTAAEWGALVKAKSIDPAAKANVPVDLAGDLGMVSPPGDPRGGNTRVPDAVRAAVFEIPNVGEVLPRVVRVGSQLYIVRLSVKTEAQDRTLAESERQIRVKLAQEKLRAREEDLITQLKAKFPVQIDDTKLAAVKVDLTDPGRAGLDASVAPPPDAH